MTNRPFVIFDIDGTISDYSHRRDLAHEKDWDAFHARCIDDPVIVPVADLMRLTSMVASVILLTGRNEKFRPQTLEWLRRANLNSHAAVLLMRPDDNFQKSQELKITQITEYFGSVEQAVSAIWFVVEDHDGNTEAMRNMGLTVLQSAPDGH